MDTTALMKMGKTQMLARIEQGKFPKDLTKQEVALMVEVSISYGLDPLMQELMIYQGNPYPTINARYRKAQETGKFDGIDTRPATEEERKVRHAKEGDYLYRAEVWVKGASHPFVGWGRVRAAETQGSPHLPIVKDPDRQAEKRAEAMGLRKAFSMPVPFQSWEEFQERRAETDIEAEYKVVVDEKTGEITEPEPKPELEPEPAPAPEPELIPAETPKEKKDRKITKAEIAELDKVMARAHWDNMRLSKYVNEEKGWKIPNKSDFSLSQYEETIKYIKATIGE